MDFFLAEDYKEKEDALLKALDDYRELDADNKKSEWVRNIDYFGIMEKAKSIFGINNINTLDEIREAKPMIGIYESFVCEGCKQTLSCEKLQNEEPNMCIECTANKIAIPLSVSLTQFLFYYYKYDPSYSGERLHYIWFEYLDWIRRTTQFTDAITERYKFNMLITEKIGVIYGETGEILCKNLKHK